MIFRGLLGCAAMIVFIASASTADAAGDRRVALVIGNNDYQYAKKLDNAVADAQAFRRELEARGFQVVYRENANRRAMNGAMEEFVGKLSTDAIGLIYYSGHGVQINGANYLIPTDLSAKAASDFAYDAVDLTKLVDRVSQTQAKFALAVIDACRDNPFQGTGRDIGGSRGLVAPSGNASGVMVVYSAGANQKALDRLSDADRNPNGLFTREFLKAMRIPGLTVQEAVNQIKMSVIAQAKSVGHVQTPAIYDQSVGTFVFTPGAPPAPVQTVSSSAEATRLQAELAAARAETERVKSEAAKAELGRLKADQDRVRAQKEPVKQNVPIVAVVPPVPVNKVPAPPESKMPLCSWWQSHNCYGERDTSSAGLSQPFDRNAKRIVRYEGEWMWGSPNGSGLATYSDGGKYLGQFSTAVNVPVKGTYFYPDGSTKEGIWLNNQLQREENISSQ